ncbi:addiction module protein [Alkalimarinus coralli]|uniref:addiction module protein n=1 Tax=Alkalimarinus coralli TaxID=2935863 RepID=UPI00202B2B1A|nr:addiction module protein [Alkalimarinus coralli]
MSTAAFDHLRSQIMTLSESERAELAHDLIESLDAPNKSNVSSEWEHEIEKRVAQIDAGNAKLLDRNTFRKRMEARLKG